MKEGWCDASSLPAERRGKASSLLGALTLLLALLPIVASADYRIHHGHDPAWASPAFDDSSWKTTRFDEIRDTGPIWLRRQVEISPDSRVPGHPLAIYVGGMFSHEIWWDGERIGSGGVVGSSAADEIPGPIESHFQIPDRLAGPGSHTLAVRASAFHRGFTPRFGYWAIQVGDYDRVVTTRTASANIALIALSGIVLTAVFALALFFLAGRDRSFLLLGALCITAGLLLMAESWRQLFGYTYDWHIVRLRSVLALAWTVGILLVALLVTRFPHRLGTRVLVGTAILAAGLSPLRPGWDQKSLTAFVITIGVAVAWAVFAVVRRLPGSVLALTGLGVAAFLLVLEPLAFVDNTAYFAFDFLFLCLLCSHALEVRRTQHERSVALLRSARLELEMLKKQMQPHFLMNTLTALSEWIEHDPRTAVRMIESLSEELRILGEMSNRRLVSTADELRLCRSHLSNLSLRKDVAYDLEVEGIDEARSVPPTVFHTLLENAITHGPTDEGRILLRLSAESNGAGVRYVFESPAGEENGSGPGTGTRYIEARLREAWGDDWSFRQGRHGAVWRAVIEAPG